MKKQNIMPHGHEKNEIVTLEITDMNQEGQGIGRLEDGIVVFVDDALPGERATAKVLKATTGYLSAKAITIDRASPDRVKPACGAFGRCGGCTMQHLTYPKQLEFKTKYVSETLRRVGGLENVPVLPCIGMSDHNGYRNKAQFPVAARKSGFTVIGFYAPRSHDVIDSEDCTVNDKNADIARRILRDHMKEHELAPYDEMTGKGLIRHLIVRTATGTGEVMVIVVINGRVMRGVHEFSRKLASGIRGFKSLFININTAGTNVITGDESIHIWGEKYITDTMDGLSFRISPLSFYQVNSAQTLRLYQKVRDYCALTGAETVVDLYCGIGTISLFLARHAARVIGVENVPEAAEMAAQNARLNNIANAVFHTGDAAAEMARLAAAGIRPDVVVLDPPRAGCEPGLLATLAEIAPARIVYVSCKPSTLARDLKILAASGYAAIEAQPVDMFPQTGHVETVVLMSRVDK